jgi:hypothetical protein
VRRRQLRVEGTMGRQVCCFGASHLIEPHMPINPIVDRHNDNAIPDAAVECCPACGSLAFRYPRVLHDEKSILCAGCGAFVSTYGELRRRFGERD